VNTLWEEELIDLSNIAARLDADEKLMLTYRFPVRSADGDVIFEKRRGRLLDVAEEAGLLYVSQEGEVIWIKIEEVVEVNRADGGQ
jgi:hypothetical protein